MDRARLPQVRAGRRTARDLERGAFDAGHFAIAHIDHFGNATTNIPADALGRKPHATVHLNRRTIGKLKRTYWDVAPGKPLALIGSSGLLEIAVRDGSAGRQLKLGVGEQVSLG